MLCRLELGFCILGDDEKRSVTVMGRGGDEMRESRVHNAILIAIISVSREQMLSEISWVAVVVIAAQDPRIGWSTSPSGTSYLYNVERAREFLRLCRT